MLARRSTLYWQPRLQYLVYVQQHQVEPKYEVPGTFFSFPFVIPYEVYALLLCLPPIVVDPGSHSRLSCPLATINASAAYVSNMERYRMLSCTTRVNRRRPFACCTQFAEAVTRDDSNHLAAVPHEVEEQSGRSVVRGNIATYEYWDVTTCRTLYVLVASISTTTIGILLYIAVRAVSSICR